MPAAPPPPERRNLEQLRAAQVQRNTPRRGSDILKNLDDILKENEDSDFLLETKKAKTNAELERIFPGVEEDEKTLSGMYEPSPDNYVKDTVIRYPSRPDVFYNPNEQQRRSNKMFPKSIAHTELGTSTNSSVKDLGEVSDFDNDTPDDFGTTRGERDYAGFYSEVHGSPFPVGSQQYWNHIDSFSRTNRLNVERYQATRLANAQRIRNEARTNINTSGTETRAIRRRSRNSAGPVTNTRTAAQLMAQGDPARAGGRSDGRHSFRGDIGPSYNLGRLPQDLNPRLRNVETDYTVFSYSTPIAWRTIQGHWEVPRVNYSRTTQRHQSAIRNALSNTYHSTLAEASYRVSDLREQHLEQGIRLPSKNYELNIGFETFHPEPPSESMINAVVQDHVQQVINPAIERYRRRPSVQRRQSQANQSQLPLEGGIA